MSPENPKPAQRPDTAVLSAPTAELDVVESGRRVPARGRPKHARPPHVRVGKLMEGGLAPAVAAIVERGVRRRPTLATGMRAEVQLEFDEGYPPVRAVFGERLVLIEDGPAVAADLRVKGAVPDLVSLMVTPLLGGLPNPIDARGRAALGLVAGGRVRVEGRLALMRRLIRLMRV
jgi:hypothetical protein